MTNCLMHFVSAYEWKCGTICTCTILIVNLPPGRSECTSLPHRRGGKKDKQVKQHDYVTSSQSDEGLHHHNTSKMFNFVCTTVYYTLVVCYHAQSKRKKGNKKRREGSYLRDMCMTSLLNLACLLMSGNVGQKLG